LKTGRLAGQDHRLGENLGLQRIWTQLSDYEINQLPQCPQEGSMNLAGQDHRLGENLGLQKIWTQLLNYQITQLPILFKLC
jgi:hypothetical protein